MEQPRYREVAAGEGGDGPGWSREPPGDGGVSTAWNGSCVRAPEEEDDDDRDRDRDLPFPSPAGSRCSCGCWGQPAAPPSPAPQRRDGSCSLTCHYRAPATGLPEEGEEDGAGEGKGGRRPRRRQRQRSAPKEKDDGGRQDGGVGRRQRLARKRSRGDGTESPGPAEGPAGYWGPPAGYWGPLTGYWGPLAAALSQALRLGAAAGERLLCSCCRLGAGDRGRAAAGTRSWGRRVGQRARNGSLRLARWLRAGAGLFLRLLWMLLALLLLLLVLLAGCLRLCWRAGPGRVGGRRWAAGLREAAALPRTWGSLGESRWGRDLWEWVRRRVRAGVPGTGEVPGRAGGAPGAAEEEVTRLVAMAEVPEEELNPFEVLGVEATASDAELRRAYRRLAVLVHPDKSEHPRAEAAFKVLRAAWDVVSTPERRREYEIKRLAETELTRSVSEFLSRLQDDLRDAMNTMMCSKCQGKHRRFEMQRDPSSGRYCGECGGLHPAEEGDFWAESSLLGLKITYFAMMDGKIYDITEWAGCQRVGISPDTHRVPYHISFGSRAPAPPGRQRSAAKGGPPSAAELQDFFDRVFQGSSGAMPGGPFPPPPNPPGAGVPPRAEGAAPKGDTKHKRRKKLRRPLQR